MTPPRRAAAVAPLIALALTACSTGGTGGGPSAAPSATTPPGATATPVVSPPLKTPPSVTPKPTATALATDLADGGKHYAYLKKLDTQAQTFTVDVVQFLTGEAAEKAAQEDGQEAFDYYVRNQNPKLRTLTYSPAMTITTNTLTAQKTGSSSKDTTITLAELKAYFAKGEAQRRVFWFTLKGGRVVTLHEQYLP